MKMEFGNSDNKNWQLFGMIAFIIILIRFIFFDNLTITIIKYNGFFSFIFYLIIFAAIFVMFLQARETYLSSNKSTFNKLYKTVISFITGGIIIIIYTNLIFISALDRIILKYPATEKIENIKIASKYIYYSHGNPHYRITVKNSLHDFETDFKVSDNTYDNYKIGDSVTIKYLETKNGTIYIVKDVNYY